MTNRDNVAAIAATEFREIKPRDPPFYTTAVSLTAAANPLTVQGTKTEEIRATWPASAASRTAKKHLIKKQAKKAKKPKKRVRR